MYKKGLALLAKIGVSVSLLTFFLKDVDLGTVIARLEILQGWLLVGAIACLAAQMIVIATWRWEAVLETLSTVVLRARLASLVSIGVFFNQILPTTFGGDGLRIWMLSKNDTSLNVAVRSVVLDRALGFSGLLILSFLSALYLSVSYDHPLITEALKASGLILVSASTVLGTVMLSTKFGSAQLRKYFGFLGQIRDFVMIHWSRMGQLMLVSIAGHLLSFMAVWLTGLAFGIDLPFWSTLLVVPLIFLIAALPISIAGWGVREGGMIIALGLLGVSGSDATLVSVTIGLLLVLLGVLGGLHWLLSDYVFVERNRTA
jgi:uncharacterized protein (TIRG00374 family)